MRGGANLAAGGDALKFFRGSNDILQNSPEVESEHDLFRSEGLQLKDTAKLKSFLRVIYL